MPAAPPVLVGAAAALVVDPEPLLPLDPELPLAVPVGVEGISVDGAENAEGVLEGNCEA